MSTPISNTTTQPTRGHGKALAVSVAASVGGFLFGFDTAVINGTVDAVQATFEVGTFVLGLVVASALLGAAAGAFCCGRLADRWGRPRVMSVAAVLFIVSCAASGLAVSFVDLALWRFVGGMAVGIASVLGPVYISEVAPAAIRGRLASFQQMSIVLGIFAALLCNAAIAGMLGGADAERWAGLPAWRWMFIAGVVPSVVYLCIALTLPESPRHLAARGDTASARRVLRSLLGLGDEAARRAVDLMARASQVGSRPSLKNLRSRRYGLLPIVWVGIGIAALQALVGIDVIFYYSTSLWRSVGFTESDSFLLSVVSSVVNVVATVVAILFIDRVGRRRLLLVGSAGMTVALVTMAVGFSQSVEVNGEPQFLDQWGPVTLTAANVFVVFFAISWGPVVWVLLGEMFPAPIRALAASVAATANWTGGILLNLTFPVLRELSLPGSYALYAVFAAASFLLVYAKVPETKHKALEEMSEVVLGSDTDLPAGRVPAEVPVRQP